MDQMPPNPAGPGGDLRPATPVSPLPGGRPNSQENRGAELSDNIAGMLAYFTVVPAIVFLVMEPYRQRFFVRFHSLQCLFLAVACFAVFVGLMILGMIPGAGVLVLLVGPMLWLLGFLAACVCLLKAYQGQIWKLPVIGELAEKRAGMIE